MTVLTDGSYEVRSFATDAVRNNVCAYGVFTGTHWQSRGSGSQRDQAEHIQAAIDDRGPGTMGEPQPGPKHHRRGQHALQPSRDAGGEDRQAFAAHLQDEHRHAVRKRPPEQPRHVRQFWAAR